MSPVLYKSQSPCQVGRGTVKIIEEILEVLGKRQFVPHHQGFPLHLHIYIPIATVSCQVYS